MEYANGVPNGKDGENEGSSRDKSGNLLAVAAKIRRRLFVGVGVFHTHLVCHFESCSNLDQLSLTDTWTPSSGLLPGLAIFDKLRPKGEEAALHRFDRVDAAATFFEKGTLLRIAARLTDASHVSGAIDVASFEVGLIETKEAGSAANILFAEVDVTGNLATFAATGLAGEANFEIGSTTHATPA